jgi:hypothetical protein
MEWVLQLNQWNMTLFLRYAILNSCFKRQLVALVAMLLGEESGGRWWKQVFVACLLFLLRPRTWAMGVCSCLSELHPDRALLASAVKCNSDVCVGSKQGKLRPCLVHEC